ncbi:MAG TPA: alpha/beta hydrolase-fold protein [Actinomycetes bacterium]|nr:alpha/beta hydrolase-fold protein [Actinomycetes bacterium]
MRRDVWTLEAEWPVGAGRVIAYGHWGTPVLFFPAEGGSASDLENRGIVHALAEPIDAGRLKLYAVDSIDHSTWSDHSVCLEERARRHEGYHAWITDRVAPAIHGDCGGRVAITTAGPSLGAFHAVNTALRRADLFPRVLGMSGNYDPTSWNGWGERGDALYFNAPFMYLEHMQGDHLDWLRRSVFVQLCVGRGAWEENPTRALPSTLSLGALLRARGIPHAVDVWGEDTPHDWPSWARMAAKHLGEAAY